jgi:chemotaxis protein CheX
VVVVDAHANDARVARPIPAEVRALLLESFAAATCAALGEMAGTTVIVKPSDSSSSHEPSEGFSAVLDLQSAVEGPLILQLPRKTASALASRILAGVTDEVDEDLICDCLGEVANVVAGQAKAVLAETPCFFAFSIPKVVVGDRPELQSGHDENWLVISFESDLGSFTSHLFLKP